MLASLCIVIAAAALHGIVSDPIDPTPPSSSAPDAPREPAEALILQGVRVVDVESGTLGDPVSVHLAEGRIVEVTADEIEAEARVIDLPGRCVIPGLVDCHVHATAGPEGAMLDGLRRSLRGGVTRVRDMGGNGIVLRRLRAASVDLGIPEIHFSAVLAGPTWMERDPRARGSAHGAEPGGQAWLRTIDETTPLVEVMRAAAGFGADGIKIYADLEPALVERLIVEAERAGLRTWSHATVFPTSPREAVGAGIEALSHAESLLFAADEAVPPRYHGAPRGGRGPEVVDTPAIRTILAEMARRGTYLDATLTVSRIRADRGLTDADHLDAVFAVTRAAAAAGVPILAGTDFLIGPTDALPNLHDELRLLVDRCGLTPAEALRSATLHPAAMLRRADEFGRVVPGLRADLVVLRGNPLEDIRSTRDIDLVIRGGAIVERADPDDRKASPPAGVVTSGRGTTIRD